ncbi:MAG TPA: DUF5677 domain-containing protein [Stellaceae bacterium]|nr:DUF5677 domain-containing protein [Stellaceae bacterium]
MATIEQWKGFAGRVHAAATQMATSINVPITDETHIYGAALLGRTISNFQSVLSLLAVRQMIEAELVMRACLENLLYAALLAKERANFIREMEQVDQRARKAEGEFMISRQIGDSAENVELRQFLKTIERTSGELTPKGVASRGALVDAYIMYAQASRKAAHPTITSLDRHFVETASGRTFMIVSPVDPEDEIETIEFACHGLLGTCYSVAEILGGTMVAPVIRALADEIRTLNGTTKETPPQ